MKISKALAALPISSIISSLAYAYYDSSTHQEKPKKMLQLSLINLLIIVLVFFVFLPATWFSLNYVILKCLEQNLAYSVIKAAISLSIVNAFLLLILICLLIRFKNQITEKREALASKPSSKTPFTANLFLSLCKALSHNLNNKL